MDARAPEGICPKPATLSPVARDAALDRLLNSAHGKQAQAEWDAQLLAQRADLIKRRKAASAAFESWSSVESKRVFALAAELEQLEKQLEARRDELRAANAAYEIDRQERRGELASLSDDIAKTLPSAVTELMARADVIRAAAPFNRLAVAERMAAALEPLNAFIHGDVINTLDPDVLLEVRAAVETIAQFGPAPVEANQRGMPLGLARASAVAAGVPVALIR
jgi:hypothetical protein